MTRSDEIEMGLAGMDVQRAQVLDRPLREGWAPVVGVNLYEVADEDWERHQELVNKLKAAPQSWVDEGARIRLLARWRAEDSPGIHQVIWVNWFPSAYAFLGPEATDSERHDLEEWLSIIRNRQWFVAEEVTAAVDPQWRPPRPESAADE